MIIDEPFAAVPVLRIQEHISAQIDEQVVDVPATTSQEDIAESMRLNPHDRISDRIDEQIVPTPLIQDENIEMNLEENDELVQPFLRKCSSRISPCPLHVQGKNRRARASALDVERDRRGRHSAECNNRPSSTCKFLRF